MSLSYCGIHGSYLGVSCPGCFAETSGFTKKTNAAKFENGATRSHHAPRYELLRGCKPAIDRLVKRLELGASIHGDFNWLGGGPAFVEQSKRHLAEHFLNWSSGDTSDDHVGAMLANLAFICYFEGTGDKDMPKDATAKDVVAGH